ncbi:hypothetical protein PM082_015553, partial [Marasmius tenuissimus]
MQIAREPSNLFHASNIAICRTGFQACSSFAVSCEATCLPSSLKDRLQTCTMAISRNFFQGVRIEG